MFYETLILGGSCVPPVTTKKGENNENKKTSSDFNEDFQRW